MCSKSFDYLAIGECLQSVVALTQNPSPNECGRGILKPTHSSLGEENWESIPGLKLDVA